MKFNWEQLLKERGFTVFGKFGEGAYSTVKLAFSSELERDVAVKCISFRGAPKEFTEKFLPRELRILPLLCHKHIVHIHEVFEHYDSNKRDSYVCIVMEAARHGDLLQYIQRKGALPEPEIKRFFWQLSQAIEYCHSQHICHRDLKCENLLLDKYNNILLTDFGFAKPIGYDHGGMVAMSRTFCGSAAYAAPEVLQGQPYDPRKHDIWSMGVVLYIMTCGHMPFDDSNVRKMLQIQLRKAVHFPSRLHGVLSRNLVNLIRRLLEPTVRKRYTIHEVLKHPFLEGYHGESVGRLMYRKVFDFFAPGRGVISFSTNKHDLKHPCCPKALRRRSKKFGLNFVKYVNSTEKKQESFSPSCLVCSRGLICNRGSHKRKRSESRAKR